MSITQLRQKITWRDEFRPERLLSGTASGLLLGLTEAIVAISFGTLVFSGVYAPFEGYGIGLALVSVIIATLTLTFFSSIRGSIASVQDGPSIILAVLAADLATHFTDIDDHATRMLPTMLILLALSTFTTGLILYLVGRFHLGRLVRFIPYPVVGGFLAGTGWLLAVGSFGMMTDYSLTLKTIPNLLQPEQMMLWIPGVIIALILFYGPRVIKHTLALPGLILAIVPMFFLVLRLSGIGISEALDSGLLLGLGGDFGWQPITPAVLRSVDWDIFFLEFEHIPALIALTMIGLLLNLQGIEAGLGRDIEPDRELEVAGLINLVSGLAGGLVSYHTVAITSLNKRIGQSSRLAGLLIGAICLGLLIFGADILRYFPRSLLGGIVLFLGLDFLYDWVIGTARRFSRIEYAILLLILIVIATVDFLVGVGVGLVIMILLFAINYSRTDTIRHAVDGRKVRSNVRRWASERLVLDRFGDETQVYELQGFLFFGSAHALYERIRDTLKEERLHPIRFLVLDFQRVSGIDSTAIQSLAKIAQLGGDNSFTLILSHMHGPVLKSIVHGGMDADNERVIHTVDLDRAIEWCEDQILLREHAAVIDPPEDLVSQLAREGFDKDMADQLPAYLEEQVLNLGDLLIEQGEVSGSVYFIESGTVSVEVATSDGGSLRLATAGPGTVIGEIGLFLDSVRTASVIASGRCIVHQLDNDAYDRMKVERPELAIALSEFMGRMLSERLTLTTKALESFRS